MATHKLHFGNLIAHFGTKPMLDHARDIVIPAILDRSMRRTYGEETEYFFSRTRVVKFDTNTDRVTFCLFGEFVKNTVFHSEQKYIDGQGTVTDDGELEYAPSAYFLIILNTHKVLYLPKTSHAPNLKAFSTTLQHRFRVQRERWIEEMREAEKASGRRITKQQISKRIGKPKVTVVPLSSQSSIDSFIDQFKTLTEVRIRVLKTNDEIRGKDVYDKLEKLGEQIESTDTGAYHKNKEGLKKSEAKKQVHESSATGNAQIKLRGFGKDGETLFGDNQNMLYSVPIVKIPKQIAKIAELMKNAFDAAMSKGIIKTDKSLVAEPSAIKALDAEYEG